MDPRQNPRWLADMAVEADPSAPVRLWYFSFADGTRPKGTQFLGGLYLRAKTFSGALTKSHKEGLNPGGEVRFAEADPDVVPEEWIGRLLSREELEEQDRLAGA